MLFSLNIAANFVDPISEHHGSEEGLVPVAVCLSDGPWDLIYEIV